MIIFYCRQARTLYMSIPRLVAIWSLPFVLIAGEPALKTKTSDDGVLVTEGDMKVLFYQRKMKSKDGRHGRANYVHPLFDLDGHVLTEDFPVDHLHHRGIFWAWCQLWVGDRKIGDGWFTKDIVWDVHGLRITHDEDGSVRIQVAVDWKSPQWHDGEKAIVKETTSIQVYPQHGNSRKLDFKIHLQATEPDTQLGGVDNVKGYGGFSTRIKLPDGIRFTGEKGEVTPKRTSIPAGPWMDMTAQFDKSGMSGLTVLCHPQSAGYPQPWLLRNKGSMQNSVWPGQYVKPLLIHKPLILRYRLILHKDKVSVKTIHSWQREFAAMP